MFTRRTDAEAEAPVFWSSDANRRLTGKVPDAGKDGGQKEKRASEYEMVGWHHQCNVENEFQIEERKRKELEAQKLVEQINRLRKRALESNKTMEEYVV